MSAGRIDAEPPRRGLVDRVIAAYWDFSASTRALLAERPGDATLLSFILVAAIIGLGGDLAAQTIERGVGAGPWSDEELDRMTGQVVARLMVLPLGVYLVSAIVGVLARRFGGAGGWYETRLAMAWALVVGAPWTFAATMLSATVVQLGAPWPSHLVVSVPLLGVALYIWAACLAGAHGFSSPLRVAAVAAGLCVGFAGLIAGLAQLLRTG